MIILQTRSFSIFNVDLLLRSTLALAWHFSAAVTGTVEYLRLYGGGRLHRQLKHDLKVGMMMMSDGNIQQRGQ